MGNSFRKGAMNVSSEKLEKLVVGSIYDESSELCIDWLGESESEKFRIVGTYEAEMKEGFYDIYCGYQLDSFNGRIKGWSFDALRNIKKMYPNLKEVELSGDIAKGYRINFEELGYKIVE